MNKKLLQELIDKIINDYKNNISIIQIAKTYHIGHTTIEQIIKDNNLTRPSRYELSQEIIDNIINDFNKPMSISEIALKYNMSRARIRKILNNNGLEHRQKLHLNKLSQDIINEILEKYKNGVSFNQLKKQYHCSKEIIRQYLIMNNISLHKSEINLEKLLPEIIKDFNQPMFINAIAQKYNLHRSTIQRLLKENNQDINRSFYKNIFSEEQINSIINDFNLPMQICNIADKYHSHPETIRKILIDNNQDINRPFYKNVLNDKQVIEIINQYNKGIGLIELADKYHISSNTLKELLTINNIDIRTDNIHERISDDIIQQLIHDYTVNNLTIKELSAKYNVILSTIYRIFQRNNITIRNDSAISQEIWNQVENIYHNNDIISFNELTKIVNISQPTISKHFKKLKLKSKRRQLSYNWHIFDNLDNEEKYYWLGFLFADGHISDHGISIRLAEKDIDQLERFKKFMQADENTKIMIRNSSGYSKSRPTNLNKIYNEVRINFGSVHLAQVLHSHGLIRNKTYNGYFIEDDFNNISNEWIMAFLRGYIDGDGYISKNNYNIVIVVYSKKIMQQLVNLIIKVTDIAPRIYHKKNHESMIYSINISNIVDYFHFCHLLYKNATIYMPRKLQNFLNVKQNLQNKLKTNTNGAYTRIRKNQELMDIINYTYTF